jgi:hypothetical protein
MRVLRMVTNQFGEIPNKMVWRLLVEAAKRAMEAGGYDLNRVPGRGLSNLWLFERDGKRGSASIRTSRDRWFAFPPTSGGRRWKTLDDVDIVLVSALDKPDKPTAVEIYIFDADAVRARFKAAYAARIGAGHKVKDNFGMWLKLDRDDRGLPTSVGSGLADDRPPVAIIPLEELLADGNLPIDAPPTVPALRETPAPVETISHVMAATRERVAEIAGVRLEAVKLDVKIEY